LEQDEKDAKPEEWIFAALALASMGIKGIPAQTFLLLYGNPLSS